MARAFTGAGVAGVFLVLAAVPGLALPRPVEPRDGAKVASSSPLFVWALPAAEQADEISIARLPDRDADGRFVEANVVATGLLAPDAERWRPPRPLWAGRYWWIVSSTVARAGLVETLSSAPSEFTIPIVLQVRRIHGPFGRTLTVRWRGNVRRARITVRMVSRGLTIWTGVRRAAAPAPGATVATRFVVPARYARQVPGAFFAVGIAART